MADIQIEKIKKYIDFQNLGNKYFYFFDKIITVIDSILIFILLIFLKSKNITPIIIISSFLLIVILFYLFFVFIRIINTNYYIKIIKNKGIISLEEIKKKVNL